MMAVVPSVPLPLLTCDEARSVTAVGLAASIVVARGGCSVTLFEKRRLLGGRASTHLRHGYRFNLGAHAFYRHIAEVAPPLLATNVPPEL